MLLKKIFNLTALSILFISSLAVAEVRDHGFGGGYNGGDYNRRPVCQVELLTIRGGLLDRFRDIDCRYAMRQCHQELSFRHARGQNPYARCEVVRGGGGYGGGHNGGGRRGGGHNGGGHNGGGHNGGGQRRIVTCTGSDHGWEEHFGGHSATSYDEVQSRREALLACERIHGSCYVTCN